VSTRASPDAAADAHVGPHRQHRTVFDAHSRPQPRTGPEQDAVADTDSPDVEHQTYVTTFDEVRVASDAVTENDAIADLEQGCGQ
jgi:hypothetical protein